MHSFREHKHRRLEIHSFQFHFRHLSMKTVRQSHCSLSHFPEPLFLPSPLRPFYYFTSPSSYISLLLCRSFTIRTHPCHSLISLSLKKPPFSSCTTTVAPSIPIPPGKPSPEFLPQSNHRIQTPLDQNNPSALQVPVGECPQSTSVFTEPLRAEFRLIMLVVSIARYSVRGSCIVPARVRFCWEGCFGSGRVGA